MTFWVPSITTWPLLITSTRLKSALQLPPCSGDGTLRDAHVPVQIGGWSASLAHGPRGPAWRWLRPKSGVRRTATTPAMATRGRPAAGKVARRGTGSDCFTPMSRPRRRILRAAPRFSVQKARLHHGVNDLVVRPCPPYPRSADVDLVTICGVHALHADSPLPGSSGDGAGSACQRGLAAAVGTQQFPRIAAPFRDTVQCANRPVACRSATSDFVLLKSPFHLCFFWWCAPLKVLRTSISDYL